MAKYLKNKAQYSTNFFCITFAQYCTMYMYIIINETQGPVFLLLGLLNSLIIHKKNEKEIKF